MIKQRLFRFISDSVYILYSNISNTSNISNILHREIFLVVR